MRKVKLRSKDEVYEGYGIRIRRIVLGVERGKGPGYEVHARSDGSVLPRSEFKRMILVLVEHLMEAEADGE